MNTQRLTSALLDQFVSDLEREGTSVQTIRAYVRDLTLFDRWLNSTSARPLPLASISTATVETYKEHMVMIQNIKPATMNRRVAALRRFLGWAQGKGFVAHNTATGVKFESLTPAAPKLLSHEELDRLVSQVKLSGNPRDYAIIELLQQTGLRVGELVGLHMSDVTLDTSSGTVQVRAGRGQHTRQIPLNASVRGALSKYVAARPTSPSDYVFLGQRGRRLHRNAIYRIVVKYARLAGIVASPQTLSHTFAQFSLTEGTEVTVTVDQLEHLWFPQSTRVVDK